MHVEQNGHGKKVLLEFQRSNPYTEPPRELLQVISDPDIERRRREDEEHDRLRSAGRFR